MKATLLSLMVVGSLLLWAGDAWAVKVESAEMARAKSWIGTAFGEKAAVEGRLPFSFLYDGKPSAEVMKTWTVQGSAKPLDEQRVQHTLVWTDPATKLAVRCVAVEYLDFPTVEWTVYFKNTNDTDTPIIENIQAIDTKFNCSAKEAFVLHHIKGDMGAPDSYQPLTDTLSPNTTKKIANVGGHPTNGSFPYYNLQFANDGLIYVLSWTGQWNTAFTRDNGCNLNITGGQELTHFKLFPGEEVRSPLVALQFYKGDWLRGQNIWRRWMVKHNMPRPGGELPPPTWKASSSHQLNEMTTATEENQKYFIDRYIEEGLKADYWWMDAGWYVNNGTWRDTGTWEVDKKRFPNGFRAISDHAHAKGVKTLVWFEPERVAEGTWLAETHPEWIHGGARGGLLKLSDPECREWLTKHISKILTVEGIDLYRQDCNMDPLSTWREADSQDRQGISEIRHIEGYFAYWDGLLKEHPGMLIDSCCGGGRRNDLETLRRAVPFARSDYLFDPIGLQGHMYGISSWIPYTGTGFNDRSSIASSKIFNMFWVPKGESFESDDYLFRSVMCSSLTAGVDVREKTPDYPTLRRLVAQWRQVAPNYYGDYYPLLPWSLDKTAWMAWQFDRPEEGEGMVQVFRRSESPFETGVFRLSGLDPEATYSVTDLDVNQPREVSGRELLEKGLTVTIKDKSAAVVVVYKKVK